jgi:AraC family ethanolamine operon transcriptional activator
LAFSRVDHFATTDPDVCANHLRALGMRIRHNRISGGQYSAAIDTARLPGMRISKTTYAPAITAHGASPERQYALVLPISSPEGVSLNQAPLRAGEVGLVHPGREFHFIRPSGFRAVLAFPDMALVDRLCEAMFGHTFARMVRVDRPLPCSAEALAACAQRFAEADAGLANGPATERAERLTYELIDMLLGIVRPPDPVHGWSARERIVRKALDLVAADEGNTYTVAELCLKLGVAIRTLDDAFHSCLGMPPRRFMIAMRLNHARRHLSRPRDEDTVTSVATRFGFFHFGHFARHYARLFGELPSQTLSRAKR